MLYLFNIFAIFCLMVEGKTLEGQSRDLADCEGSLSLVSPCGVAHNYQENTSHIRFNAAKAVLEGCGCYRLHERKNYRGKSFTVAARGRHVVTLRKVRSISKISCSPPVRTRKNSHSVPHLAIIMKVKNQCKNKRYEKHY